MAKKLKKPERVLTDAELAEIEGEKEDAAARAAEPDELTFTVEELGAFKTQWVGTKNGLTVVIEKDTKHGGFRATLTSEHGVFTGTGKGYASSARDAAASFNKKAAR